MKRKIAMIVAVVMLGCTVCAMPAMAASGELTPEEQEYWEEQEWEALPIWRTMEDGQQYLYKGSTLLNNTWQYEAGKGWTYAGAKGQMVKSSWVKYKNAWYYLKEDGSMQSCGWAKINGKWYYFGTPGGDGKMMYGWQKVGDKWYYLGTAEDGAMKIGWQKISGKWYLFGNNEDGAMKTGWQKVKGIWYYMYSDGSMASSTWIGKYYVDAGGAWVMTR